MHFLQCKGSVFFNMKAKIREKHPKKKPAAHRAAGLLSNNVKRKG